MSDRINPSPGILLYTRIKKSPYYYGSRRHGVALYSVYNHHYHPRHYGDPVAEYWQLLEGVTVWDVGGAERQVEISGPDAFRFANLLTPRNLERCQVGQCKYAFITDERGGIINDPVLLRLGENHFWLSLADSDVLLWCKGVAYGLGLDVRIVEPDVGPMQIQGPRSKEVMTDLFGADILAVPYYFMVERELDGMRLVISRTGYSGELGYELYLRDASRDGPKLWGRGHPGRRTVWTGADRPVPYPPHRGRHPCPRLRHDHRGEPLRGRLRLQMDGRARAETGLHRSRRAAARSGGGRGAKARGR
jgi:glycine cleavage system aminomethyltransferase T